MIQVSCISDLIPYDLREISLGLGNFDALHLGHQHLIQTLHRQAQVEGSQPVVLSFSPAPREILYPDLPRNRLLSQEYKLHLLKNCHIPAVVMLPFDTDIAAQGPEEFIESILQDDAISLRSIVVGKNWRFGHNAAGDINLLRCLAVTHAFTVIAVEDVCYNGTVISSTTIREAVRQGKLEYCHRLLGRPFSVFGLVTRGKGIAAANLNCPTANLVMNSDCHPPPGVYAGRARIDPTLDTERSVDEYSGIIYVGRRQSLNDHPSLEIHLFDFEQDLYGRSLEIQFIRQIRKDRVFADEQTPREQIDRDIARTRRFLNTKIA